MTRKNRGISGWGKRNRIEKCSEKGLLQIVESNGLTSVIRNGQVLATRQSYFTALDIASAKLSKAMLWPDEKPRTFLF